MAAAKAYDAAIKAHPVLCTKRFLNFPEPVTGGDNMRTDILPPDVSNVSPDDSTTAISKATGTASHNIEISTNQRDQKTSSTLNDNCAESSAIHDMENKSNRFVNIANTSAKSDNVNNDDSCDNDSDGVEVEGGVDTYLTAQSIATALESAGVVCTAVDAVMRGYQHRRKALQVFKSQAETLITNEGKTTFNQTETVDAPNRSTPGGFSTSAAPTTITPSGCVGAADALAQGGGVVGGGGLHASIVEGDRGIMVGSGNTTTIVDKTETAEAPANAGKNINFNTTFTTVAPTHSLSSDNNSSDRVIDESIPDTSSPTDPTTIVADNAFCVIRPPGHHAGRNGATRGNILIFNVMYIIIFINIY